MFQHKFINQNLFSYCICILSIKNLYNVYKFYNTKTKQMNVYKNQSSYRNEN